ncbi:hypothetical protein KW800_01735 [Candidatus Parcubacteria bacterium]|nr:hypothetical protein [Candidatus Parcubacteria bacterium]
MQYIQKNKSILIAIALFALVIWAYGAFIKGPSTSVATNQSAQKVGGDVLDLYSSLKAVSLDQTLFSTALYRHLQDFSSDIPLQPVGRTNPFDVIGR